MPTQFVCEWGFLNEVIRDYQRLINDDDGGDELLSKLTQHRNLSLESLAVALALSREWCRTHPGKNPFLQRLVNATELKNHAKQTRTLH